MPTETIIQNPPLLNGSPIGPMATLPEQEDAWMGVLSRKPPWVVRWGIVCFTILLLILLSMASVIRYPDRVSAQAKLMALNPPRPLPVRTGSRLLYLLYEDGDTVKDGALVAVLESTANYQQVLAQKSIADSLFMLAATSQSHLIPTYFASLVPSYPPPMLGELQNQRQVFYAAWQAYVQYLGKGYYLKQRHMLLQDRQNLLAQQATTAEQLELTQKEVALAGENFKVSETLSEQKVIAPVEYRTEAGKWLGKQLQLPQMKSTQLAIGGQILEKQKQLAALENEIAQQQGIFIQAVQNWLAAIAEWERKYLIYAPCDGKLVLHGFYQPGRPLQAGEILGNVQPTGGGYFLETTLPQYNFGKLAIGQPALIRFAAYPSEEFGSIEGRLEMFKPIPTDSGYLAKLTLPNGLKTHLGKTLVYREGLQASVEIITDDRTVLDRVMAGLRKSIQR